MSPLDPDRERAWLRQAQRGDHDAYARLVTAHLPDLWRLCLAARLQRDDAERLAIEVARGGWVTLRPRGTADGMLAQLSGLVRMHALAGGPPVLDRRPDGSAWETPTATADDSAEAQRVLAAFAALAIEDRLLLALRLLSRQPVPALAATVGLSADTVHSRLAWLRGALDECVRGTATAAADPPHLTPGQQSALLDGALAPAMQQACTSHLAQCPACRDLQSRFHRHDVVLRRLLDFDPGDAHRRTLGERIAAALPAGAGQRPGPAPHVPVAEVVEEARSHDAPAVTGAAPGANAAPPSDSLHSSLDAVLAEFEKGFEQPRRSSLPVEPPRTIADLARPASRPMPRPVVPAPAETLIAPPPPAPAPAEPRMTPTAAPAAAAGTTSGATNSRGWAFALAAALAWVILYALPPVITLPAPRLPRVEVAARRGEGETAPPRPAAHRTGIAAPVATTSPAVPPAARDSSAAAGRPRPPAEVATGSRMVRPAAARPTPEPPADHVAAPRPSAPPAVAGDRESPAHSDDTADWPLLCGEIVDDTGTPVVGARIALADLDLSVRSDRRGRFCLAAPAGERTYTVSALGFTAARGVVTVGPGRDDLRVRLGLATP